MQEIDELKKEIEELKTCKENLLKELNKEATSKALDLKNHQRRETALVDTLAEKNEEIEKLKTEVTEALAKRDYWQNLANKEAADAKKVKWDCEKEMEWQKKKLQEFDHVLTKYRAKIKELEGHSELDEKSQLAILAGAYAIRKHFDDGVYCNIAAKGIISWKHAEQILTDMVTKEQKWIY